LKLSNKKGWHEAADHTGKAPMHVIAATKADMKAVLRYPMQKVALTGILFSGEMWHATNEENAKSILNSKEFIPSKYSSADLELPPDFGVGSYFDIDYETVSQYGETVLKVKTTRPLLLFEAKSLSDKGFVQMNWNQLNKDGYDGAIYRSGRYDNEIVIFNPKRLVVPLYDVGQVDFDNAYIIDYNMRDV